MNIDDRVIYLAGLFDGEGTFSIQMSIRTYKGRESVNFGPRMSMTLKYGSEVLEELKLAFGGEIYPYKDGIYRWSLGGREGLMAATNALLPHLRIKKKVAEQFLEALSLFPVSRKAHRDGERSWTMEMVLAVARIALALNPHKTSKKGLAYLRNLEAVYQN